MLLLWDKADYDVKNNVSMKTQHTPAGRLLQLLLGAKLVRMSALLLAAVFSTRRKASVAPEFK